MHNNKRNVLWPINTERNLKLKRKRSKKKKQVSKKMFAFAWHGKELLLRRSDIHVTFNVRLLKNCKIDDFSFP